MLLPPLEVVELPEPVLLEPVELDEPVLLDEPDEPLECDVEPGAVVTGGATGVPWVTGAVTVPLFESPSPT
ncbi:MAG: hypothetical protein ACREHG_09445 [Candidatus Saccharimonadales bacterium]